MGAASFPPTAAAHPLTTVKRQSLKQRRRGGGVRGDRGAHIGFGIGRERLQHRCGDIDARGHRITHPNRAITGAGRHHSRGRSRIRGSTRPHCR